MLRAARRATRRAPTSVICATSPTGSSPGRISPHSSETSRISPSSGFRCRVIRPIWTTSTCRDLCGASTARSSSTRKRSRCFWPLPNPAWVSPTIPSRVSCRAKSTIPPRDVSKKSSTSMRSSRRPRTPRMQPTRRSRRRIPRPARLRRRRTTSTTRFRGSSPGSTKSSTEWWRTGSTPTPRPCRTIRPPRGSGTASRLSTRATPSPTRSLTSTPRRLPMRASRGGG